MSGKQIAWVIYIPRLKHMKIKNKILIVITLLTLTIDYASAFSRGRPIWERRSSSPASNETVVQLPAHPKPAPLPDPLPVPVPLPTPAPVTRPTGYLDGDIIFIQSQSSQSAALREATGSIWTHVGILVKQNSQWYVAEAVGPVVITPLAEFIGRSKNKAYQIYRFRHFDPISMKSAMLEAIQKYNKPYDIYFEWNKDLIYCSELTYHVMKDVTGFELGRLQKMKEMRLDGPYTQALIKKRYTETGRDFDPEELIVTPFSQVEDEDVTLIEAK